MTRVTRGRECAERQGWGCEIVDLAEPKENKEQSRLMRRRVMVLWPLMDLAVIFFFLIILESICNFDPGLKYPAFLSCTLLCCLPFIQQPFSSSFLWEAFLGRSVGRWQLPSQSSPPVSTVTLLYTNKMHLTLACGGCKSFRIYLCINLIFLFPCLDVLYVSVTVIKQWLSLFFFFFCYRTLCSNSFSHRTQFVWKATWTWDLWSDSRKKGVWSLAHFFYSCPYPQQALRGLKE